MLNRDKLRFGLSPIFRKDGMPSSASEAVSSWAGAYSSYAQDALAGVMFLGPLVLQPVPGEFLQALDATLRNMWLAAMWIGPPLVGRTLFVPPLPGTLLSNSANLSDSFDVERALSLIVEAVHTYTTSITVSVVPPSGTPSIVQLT